MIHISPTQIEKGQRCERTIGYEYVEHIPQPPTAKKDFGSAVHTQIERWLREGQKPDDSPEGQTARQGIRNNWLPPPSRSLLIEHDLDLPFSKLVHLRGRIDCIAPGEIPIVIDHKSTSDLKWAKTKDELTHDTQAILYSIYAATLLQSPFVRARWIYYAATNPKKGPRKPSGAKAIEVQFDVSSDEFLRKWEKLSRDINRIAEIRINGFTGAELRPNPDSCGAFGGCPYKKLCRPSGEDALASAIRQEERKSK
jgi:hypothetical protein